LNGHTLGFHPQTQKLKHLIQHNKQRLRKVQLSSFHLNGHTLGFHPQTQKLKPQETNEKTKTETNLFLDEDGRYQTTKLPFSGASCHLFSLRTEQSIVVL